MRQLTYDEAAAWLVEYEERNADLPPQTRRLLGLFALGAKKQCKTHLLTKLVGYSTRVIVRDQSRRWWMLLSLSGCARFWPGFKQRGEAWGSGEAWRWLKTQISTKRRRILERRMGTQPWRASRVALHKHGRGGTQRWYWYKGGAWPSWTSWGKLLITGEPLPRRPHALWHRTIPQHQYRLLERQIRAHFKPLLDERTVPEIKWAVVHYVQERLTELRGGKRPVSLGGVAWFLQTTIPQDYWGAWDPNPKSAGGRRRGWRPQRAWR